MKARNFIVCGLIAAFIVFTFDSCKKSEPAKRPAEAVEVEEAVEEAPKEAAPAAKAEPAKAAEPAKKAAPEAALKVGQVQGQRGRQAIVNFNLGTNPGLNELELTVTYDAERLSIDKADDITRVTSGLKDLQRFRGVRANNLAENPFKISWSGNADDKSAGDILSVRFTVLAEAPEGEAAVKVEGKATNAAKEAVTVKVTSGAVTVPAGRGGGGGGGRSGGGGGGGGGGGRSGGGGGGGDQPAAPETPAAETPPPQNNRNE
jgi:hypothetical protein